MVVKPFSPRPVKIFCWPTSSFEVISKKAAEKAFDEHIVPLEGNK